MSEHFCTKYCQNICLRVGFRVLIKNSKHVHTTSRFEEDASFSESGAVVSKLLTKVKSIEQSKAQVVCKLSWHPYLAPSTCALRRGREGQSFKDYTTKEKSKLFFLETW